MSKADTLFLGASAFTVSEVATPVLQTADVSGIVQIIVQVVIGIATLISMFKKKPKQ